MHPSRAAPQVQHSETGDALWVARSRRSPFETYALDYVVERKGIKDLVESIKGGRYERQKYALRRCGLRRVMYLIEGTPEAEVAGVSDMIIPPWQGSCRPACCVKCEVIQTAPL